MTKQKKRKKSLVGYLFNGWEKDFRKNHPNWPDRVFIPSPLKIKNPLCDIKVKVTIEEV